MIIEPLNILVKSPAPAAQARAPTVKGTTRKDKADARAEKAVDLSHALKQVANVQKNVGMIQKLDLQFAVHEATGEIMVTVRDEATGKVIREIPPHEILNLAAKVEAMVGILFDKKV